MFQTTSFTAIVAIVGIAVSILFTPFVRYLPLEIQLTTAMFLGAICSSIFFCRETSIQRKFSKYPEGKKKEPLAKVRAVLFWLMLISELAAIAVLDLKMYGRL